VFAVTYTHYACLIRKRSPRTIRAWGKALNVLFPKDCGMTWWHRATSASARGQLRHEGKGASQQLRSNGQLFAGRSSARPCGIPCDFSNPGHHTIRDIFRCPQVLLIAKALGDQRHYDIMSVTAPTLSPVATFLYCTHFPADAPPPHERARNSCGLGWSRRVGKFASYALRRGRT